MEIILMLNLPTTDWIPGNINPVRIGVYQRKADHEGMEIAYAYWNGNNWGNFGYNIETALKLKDICTFNNNLHWRGLTRETFLYS